MWNSTLEARNKYKHKRTTLGLYESKGLIADSVKVRFSLLALLSKGAISHGEYLEYLQQLEREANMNGLYSLSQVLGNHK